MQEGVNQGCPLSSTLAALVLHEILLPLSVKLNARAEARRRVGNLSDDKLGGISNVMAYVDNSSVAIPIEGLLFFFSGNPRNSRPLSAASSTPSKPAF